MSWEGKTRLQIELELMEAVQIARARYETLCQEQSRMAQDVRDIGLENRDGNLALAQSTQHHRALKAALEEYRKALSRFNSVVVDRKLPEE